MRTRSGVLTGILVAGVLFAAPAAAHEATAAPMRWGACPAGSLNDVPPDERQLFSCGTYEVPLDHARPGLGTISLALMRRAAGNSGQRLGSLFLNPGGPGGSGWGLPRVVKATFQPEVLARFDIVGFDPRGAGRSTPLRCFKTVEEADSVLDRRYATPVTRPQIDATIDAYGDLSDFCARDAGALINHMATADVARDLDLLRQAVGDKQVNYVGFSYGTLLGATYVNLFPGKVRAMVLDGNVDPRLRLTNGLGYDRERAGGFEYSLEAFLERCASEGAKCAFSDGDPKAKFAEIRDRLHDGPIPLPDGSRITLDTFTINVSGGLYNASGLAPMAVNLQGLYHLLHPTANARHAVDLSVFTKSPNIGLLDTPYDSDNSYYAVNCADKPYPRSPQLVPLLAQAWERQSRTFGRYHAFGDPLACATWPATRPNAYRGPWDQRTDDPVLLFGNYYDPATRYEQSRRMSRQLGNARLVSVDSFGHTILGHSTCVDKIAAEYLGTLRVPEPGTVCRPNVQPF